MAFLSLVIYFSVLNNKLHGDFWQVCWRWSVSAYSIRFCFISWKLQLAVLLSVVFIVDGLFPYTSNNELWQTLIYRVINYTWLLYIGLSVYSARAVLISFCQKPIKPYRQNELLMVCALLGNVVIWFAYHTSSYTSYIVGALSFSLIFLLSSVL